MGRMVVSVYLQHMLKYTEPVVMTHGEHIHATQRLIITPYIVRTPPLIKNMYARTFSEVTLPLCTPGLFLLLIDMLVAYVCKCISDAIPLSPFSKSVPGS